MTDFMHTGDISNTELCDRLSFNIYCSSDFSFQDVIDAVNRSRQDGELLPSYCTTLPGCVGHVIGYRVRCDHLTIDIQVTHRPGIVDQLTSYLQMTAYPCIADDQEIVAIILDPVLPYII